MAKTYAVVGGVTRKISKLYAIVGGVTRKMKKLYAIVGGITKLLWSGELSFNSTTTLNNYPGQPGGGSIGAYAIFAGGFDNGSYTYAATVFDSSLVKSSITMSAQYAYWMGVPKNNTYAMFGRAVVIPISNATIIDAINAALVKTAINIGVAIAYSAQASFGDYAVFAGGYYSNTSTWTTEVAFYNSSLTKNTGALSNGRAAGQGGAVNNNYAIFAGGNSSAGTGKEVDAFNSSFVRTSGTALTYISWNGRCYGAKAGQYALFYNDNTGVGNIDAYNDSLVKVTTAALSVSRQQLAASYTDDYAVFSGGQYSTGTQYNTVDVFDSNLTRTNNFTLSSARYDLRSVNQNGRILVAGGYNSGYSNLVDIID